MPDITGVKARCGLIHQVEAFFIGSGLDQFLGQPKPLAFALGCLFTNVLARPQFIAYGPGKKPWTARLAEAMGAIRVCWTVRPEDDINAKEAENDAVIFEFYHPAPKYK